MSQFGPEHGIDQSREFSKISASSKQQQIAKNTFLESEFKYPNSPICQIDYTVFVRNKIKVSDYLVEILGDNATILMSPEDCGFDFNSYVPQVNKVSLHLFMNCMSRPVQDQNLKEKGLEFADPLQALIVCAVVIKKAKDAGIDFTKSLYTLETEQKESFNSLDPNERQLVHKLYWSTLRTAANAVLIGRGGHIWISSDVGYNVPPSENAFPLST
jgi:hypothetical protein